MDQTCVSSFNYQYREHSECVVSVELTLKYDMANSWMNDLGFWRAMHDIFLSGYVARITGRVLQDGMRDAELVKEALNNRRSVQKEKQARQHSRLAEVKNLSWDDLLSKLDRFRWEEHDTIKKSPATQTAIEEAEVRLGVQLPDDYKAFMLASNGLEFLPTIDRPGLLPIEQLQWQDASALGLEALSIDLGLKLDPYEEEKIPRMSRVLAISDEGEELLWYVEPSLVQQSLEIVKEVRQQSEFPETPSWR